MHVDADLLPILGEPLAVEFANTWYESSEESFDFLVAPEWIAAWFERMSDRIPGRVPRRLAVGDITALLAVRDATREILRAATVRTTPASRSIAVLNRVARSVPTIYEARVDGARIRAEVTVSGKGFTSIVAALAIESIAFCAGPDYSRVRRCEAPNCPMFFVQEHHKRRFCHEGCAHRARQARYYRSLQAGGLA
jgi:predicted RNA-binding Zn ribbon-like protein